MSWAALILLFCAPGIARGLDSVRCKFLGSGIAPFIHTIDLLFLVLALYLLSSKRGNSLLIDHGGVFVLLFLAIERISLIGAGAHPPHRTYYELFKLAAAALFFFYARYLLSQKFHYWKKVCLTAMLAFGLLECLVGISQYFLQHATGWPFLGEIPGSAGFFSKSGCRWIFDTASRPVWMLRAYGSFSHPNTFGGFLAVFLAFISYLFDTAQRKWQKIGLATVFFIGSFTLAITYSRSAEIAFFIMAATYFAVIYWKKRSFNKRLFGVMLGSFLTCYLLLFSQIYERGGLVGFEKGAVQIKEPERIFFQKAAFRIIKESPLLGVGFNHFIRKMQSLYGAELPRHMHFPVHNIYLLIWAEAGLFALCAFLLLFFRPIYKILSGDGSKFEIMLLSAMTGLLFIGLADHYLLTVNSGRILLFLLPGLLTGHRL